MKQRKVLWRLIWLKVNYISLRETEFNTHNLFFTKTCMAEPVFTEFEWISWISKLCQSQILQSNGTGLHLYIKLSLIYPHSWPIKLFRWFTVKLCKWYRLLVCWKQKVLPFLLIWNTEPVRSEHTVADWMIVQAIMFPYSLWRSTLA